MVIDHEGSEVILGQENSEYIDQCAEDVWVRWAHGDSCSSKFTLLAPFLGTFKDLMLFGIFEKSAFPAKTKDGGTDGCYRASCICGRSPHGTLLFQHTSRPSTACIVGSVLVWWMWRKWTLVEGVASKTE